MWKTFVTFLAFIPQFAAPYHNLPPSEELEERYNGRCTRRYTPGICGASVVVVWTFVFQIQNCTERLGCPTATRTNRFNTYKRCMQLCRSLAELYAQVLAMGGRNETDVARGSGTRTQEDSTEGIWTDGRRKGDTDQENSEITTEEESSEYSDELGDPAMVNPPGYKYVSELEQIVPPDIDHVRPDLVPNPYDLFHDAFGRN